MAWHTTRGQVVRRRMHVDGSWGYGAVGAVDGLLVQGPEGRRSVVLGV